MRVNKIKGKVIILIFITLIPLSILKVLDIRHDFNSSIEAELNASQDFAEAINFSFMNYLEKIWSNQYIIGDTIISNETWTAKQTESYLYTILPVDEAILGYLWVDTRGNVIASISDKIAESNLIEKDYIKKIMAGEDKVVSNLQISSDGYNVIIPVARGIRINNELKGIIISVLDANNIKSIFPIKRLGDGSTFGIIDSNGMMVYRNSNNDIPLDKRLVREDSPSRRALKGEIVKTYARHSGFDRTERMGIDYPIKDIGWSCFVTTSVKSLLIGDMYELKRDTVIFILVFVISFVIGIIFSSRHIKSINKLKIATQEVMEGNLDYKLIIDSKEDFADVNALFNRMVKSLKQRSKDQEEYNNLKSQFLATMSHELKTPLNIILGCIQLIEKLDMRSSDFNTKILKYIKMQKQNSFRLLRLINNLIDINKSEVNQMKLSLTNGNIVSIVEDITLSIVGYTNLKGINVVFDTEIEEKIIAFDFDMIERVVLNLLSNSIKFTEPGGTIEVNIYDKGNRTQISIKDTGIGIPEDKLEAIFDRFTQIDNSFRRKSEGSGIGLSLVKYIIELHEGRILVNSELGKGSEFIIELNNRTVNGEWLEINENGISNVERINIEFSDIYM